MYGGIPAYACPGSMLFFAHKSLCFSRILTPHMRIIMPVQDPDAVHANPYACTVSQQFKHFLTLVQAFDASHTNPYSCEGSQQFRQFLALVEAFKASHTNPYAFTGS
ncbi:hypothetical protein O181_004844 [Austropuccinia psidii MF-1]|uniref:Uncharacterized protein n=1 Tax=Austropuccinia psidii MF-1 TaxID=1389203 RepID=A0A9Q3GFA9_9BASI|nr:hypothetical protein [Austropuccinia psidii MF-1]